MQALRSYQDEVGISSIKTSADADLVKNGDLAISGRCGKLIGNVDTEERVVQVVIYQVHPAFSAAATGAVDAALREGRVGRVVGRLEDVRIEFIEYVADGIIGRIVCTWCEMGGCRERDTQGVHRLWEGGV